MLYGYLLKLLHQHEGAMQKSRRALAFFASRTLNKNFDEFVLNEPFSEEWEEEKKSAFVKTLIEAKEGEVCYNTSLK